MVPLMVNPTAQPLLDHSEVNHPAQSIQFRRCYRHFRFVPMPVEMLAFVLMSKNTVGSIPLENTSDSDHSPFSIAWRIADIVDPNPSPANGVSILIGAKAHLAISRYSLPPKTSTRSNSANPIFLTCFDSLTIAIGLVDLFLKLTSYGPGMMKSGSINPYFALRITQRVPNFRAYFLLTLKGDPV